jgi:CHASE3 domain sensor protein
MRLRRRVSARFVASFAAVVLLAVFVVNGLTLTSIQASRGWIARTRRAQALVSAIRGSILDAESGERGFLLTGRADDLKPLDSAIASLPEITAELERLTADDPPQQRRLRELQVLTSTKLDALRSVVEFNRAGNRTAALAIIRSDEGRKLMDRLRQVITDMREHEDKRLEERTAKARRNLDIATGIDGAAAVGLLALGFALFRINRDIARREQLEKALRDAASFQDQFIAIVGHDLRDPLQAIVVGAHRLRSPGLPDAFAKPVRSIEMAAARMQRMIEQLLDLTRARRAGGIPVHPEPADLVAIARDAVEELRNANPTADVRFDGVPSALGHWDPDRVGQVISNLVGNAIAHGTGPVDVRVRSTGGAALLEVRNGGAPIPPELMPHLFEAFRGSSERARGRMPGLGLGLYIAERIVAAHGGKIGASSSETQGTTFTIELPVSMAGAAAAAHAPPTR